MTSLHHSDGSGDGGGGGSGGGGGRPSNRCGAVRWGVSGGGQMRLQQRQRESLTPQQLREWYTSRGGGGGSSGSHSAAVPLAVPGGGRTHLQRRPRETLTPQQLREGYVQRGASRSSARCPYIIRTDNKAMIALCQEHRLEHRTKHIALRYFLARECALGTDVLEDTLEDFECFATTVPDLMSMLIAPEGDPDAPDIPTPRSYTEAITRPCSSQWQTAMDAEMVSWKSKSTYVNVVPPPGANIVDGMWIFRVKRPPGSSPAFKARYVARGFSQRPGVDFFQTFSPTPKMTTLWVLLHVAAQRL
ncbi:unnamed protein product [Closterium sp. NIES-53]